MLDWALGNCCIIICYDYLSVSLTIYLSNIRKSPTVKPDPSLVTNQQADDKRRKTDQGQALADKTQKGTGKMIELDMVSSDEDFWGLVYHPSSCSSNEEPLNLWK